MNTPRKLGLLVVDDEPEVGNSVYHLLRHRYNVLRARSAAEAAELMEGNEVALIMTDQRMPEVTGVEMLQKMKSQYPEAVRMLFTGYADIDSVIAAINQGHVFRYLSKPWEPQELEAAVDEAAAEYERLVHQCQDERDYRKQLERVEADLLDLQARVVQLQRENEQLRAALALRPPAPPESS